MAPESGQGLLDEERHGTAESAFDHRGAIITVRVVGSAEAGLQGLGNVGQGIDQRGQPLEHADE